MATPEPDTSMSLDPNTVQPPVRALRSRQSIQSIVPDSGTPAPPTDTVVASSSSTIPLELPDATVTA